jgi:hypothetical protein
MKAKKYAKAMRDTIAVEKERLRDAAKDAEKDTVKAHGES